MDKSPQNTSCRRPQGPGVIHRAPAAPKNVRAGFSNLPAIGRGGPPCPSRLRAPVPVPSAGPRARPAYVAAHRVRPKCTGAIHRAPRAPILRALTRGLSPLLSDIRLLATPLHQTRIGTTPNIVSFSVDKTGPGRARLQAVASSVEPPRRCFPILCRSRIFTPNVLSHWFLEKGVVT